MKNATLKCIPILRKIFFFFLKIFSIKGVQQLGMQGGINTHIHYHIMQKQQFYIEDQNLKSKILNLLKKT